MKLLLICAATLILAPGALFAQELYVNTEPASNMATGSLGMRLENQGYFSPVYKNRSTLEMMYGANKYLMVHGSLYQSDIYQNRQHFEGGTVSAKYRFFSVDSVQSHFRAAFFVKAAAINNPVTNQEISLEGDNSGLQSGIVLTRLARKLALSASASYLHAFNNSGNYLPVTGNAINAVAYTASAGYLLLPKTYTNYNQVNMNVYIELLGKTNPGYGESYLDAAPAVQFIFNSVLRLDFSYRTALYNDMARNSNHNYLVRLEYNFFNIL